MKKHIIPFLLLGGAVATFCAYDRHLEREIKNEKKVDERKGDFNLNNISKASVSDINLAEVEPLTEKACESSPKHSIPIRLYDDHFDFAALTVDDLKNSGWLIDGMTASARYKDGMHAWMKRELSPKIFDVDYVGNRIQSLSIGNCEKNDLKGKFAVGNSIIFGASEDMVKTEFGQPTDITDMSKYGYKLLMYRDDSYVMVFNVNNETGLTYFSIDRIDSFPA